MQGQEQSTTIGQEIDALVAEHVFGHSIVRYKKGSIKEKTVQGNLRPLRPYSRDINAAWEVANKMSITLIPVQGGMWFALAGAVEGWNSPADLVKYMAEEDFSQGGAAIKDGAPLAICLAALTAIQKRLANRAAFNADTLSAVSPSAASIAPSLTLVADENVAVSEVGVEYVNENPSTDSPSNPIH